MKKLFFILALTAVLAGCSSSSRQQSETARRESLRLGEHSFKITTTSKDAQAAFNRGLNWTYAFAHHAAELEFRRAAAADPNCAMGYWGIALVNGPHINFPLVPPDHAQRAWEALAQAKAHAASSSDLEQRLISALEKRYANPQPEDRAPLDTAYADAMREVWQSYPNNADIGALYAESLMDVHPWDLWNKDGTPQPWTPAIQQTLERVLQLNSRHPGANHYYIHVVEASPQPEKALASANRLARLVPDSSHLVHMPSHIYARLGDWPKAAESNQKAMEADQRYRAAYPRPGFYAMYMAHNAHFLAFTAMMRGRSQEAITLARQMTASVPAEFVRDYPQIVDGFTVFPSEVLVRFGKWQEVLDEPAPPAGLPLAHALWRFNRATAYNALGQMDEARTEAGRFREAAAQVPDSAHFGNNPATNLLAIARLVLEGEMQAQEGNLDIATARLTEAVSLEDKLRYDEPPDWIQPVRHTLGAVLLRAGQPQQAELVYRQDLQIWPHNGWALLGLRNALQEQDKVAEAKTADSALKRAWAKADVSPSTTCFCQEPHAMGAAR